MGAWLASGVAAALAAVLLIACVPYATADAYAAAAGRPAGDAASPVPAAAADEIASSKGVFVDEMLDAFSTSLSNGSHSKPNATKPWESMWVLPGAVPGLALAFFGYRFIGTTIFVVAASLGGAIFYTASPSIFPNTPFCCGDKGSLEGHIIVSVVVGIATGLLARWLLRVGIFLIGATLGLGVALGLLATPLHQEHFLQTDTGVICLYAICMVVFGVLTLFFRKFFLVFTTSLGGSLLFVLGVDYFVSSNFDKAVLYALRQFRRAIRRTIKDHSPHIRLDRHFDRNTYILLAAWLAVALLGFCIQYCLGDSEDSKVQRRIIVRRGRRRNDTELEPLLRG